MDAIVDKRETSEPRVARRRGPILRLARLARLALILVVVGGVGLALKHFYEPGPQTAAAPPPAPSVTVSAPAKKQMATFTSFTGQFSAVDRVEIRAQVSGYLTEIHFTDGQLVKKGDLLFVIDPRPYEIALANAKAQVANAEASLALSRKQSARTSELMRSDYASRETMDQRTQQEAGAEASLDQAKAAVRSAELNMEWTHITSPLSGRISRHLVSIGNLVTGGTGGAATTLLTTIVSLDPIYLDFDMGEGDYIAYQRFLHRAPDKDDVNRTVDIALSDETGWKHKGRLDFLDNEMDRSSGTLRARATVPNKDLFIAAGTFARLRIPTTAPADTMLVPDAALSTDQSRTLVMTVDKDGTVVPKAVKIGDLVGDLRIIKQGLAPDDRVIVNGLMFARPGGKVTPKQGTIAVPPDQG